jgi:radical SAM protein with 4Fe4S-binding SPASM domain
MIKCMAQFDTLNIDLSAVTQEQYTLLQSGGATGHFKTVLGNLRLLADLKKNNKRAPYVKLVYVLHAHNYREIPDVFDDARRFHASLRLTSGIISKAETLIKKIARKESFRRIKSNLKQNFSARGTYLDELFMKPTRPKACYMTWYYAFISSSGNITPCCQMQQAHIMGNIHRDSFKEVWRSDRFQRFRLWGSRSLFGGTIDVCRRCCHYQDNNIIQQQLQQSGLPS